MQDEHLAVAQINNSDRDDFDVGQHVVPVARRPRGRV